MKALLSYSKHADAANPAALWRGTLLMNHLLEAPAKIYRNYMQLNCFKACCDPIGAINAYFTEVHREASEHGYYEFDRGKLGVSKPNIKIKMGNRLDFEIKNLAARLKLRDPDFSHIKKMIKIKPYSIFGKVV
jgi:hypothetical protein